MNIRDAVAVAHLTSEQIAVLRDKATEAPFSGEYLHASAPGVYVCAACHTTLFRSNQKYDSDQVSLQGWPSFADVISAGAVRLAEDTSHGMQRTEVLCSTCGGHLGHIFDDTSSPSGQHYCINSVSLTFVPAENGSTAHEEMAA